MTKTNKKKENKNKKKRGVIKHFGDDRYFDLLDCGNYFLGVHICPNSPNCMHEICTIFCLVIIHQEKLKTC